MYKYYGDFPRRTTNATGVLPGIFCDEQLDGFSIIPRPSVYYQLDTLPFALASLKEILKGSLKDDWR